MTMIGFDGLETYGDLTTASASIVSNVEATDDKRWTVGGGGYPGDNAVVLDAFGEGFAIEIDDTGSSSTRSEVMSFAMGSAYNELTNASVKEYVVGFRYFNGQLDSVSTVPTRFIWYVTVGTYGATPSHSRHATLAILADSTTLRYTPSGGTPVDAALALTPDTWHYIEVHYKPTSNANGSFMKVYVDNSLVIDETVGNVVSATFFRTLGFQLGSGISGGNNDGPDSNPIRVDDIYWLHVDGVTHTGPLGPVRAVLMSPNAEATPNDWTPSTGTDNTALIDEQDWDTADYVDATATGNDDHYDLTTLSTATTVHAMRVDAVCIAVDGTPTLHIGFDDGTADEVSKGVIGTVSTVQKSSCFPLDPSGAAWTQSSANSAEATQRMTE